MMSWAAVMFHNPSSTLMELILIMHDYVMLFMVGIMTPIFMLIFYSLMASNFNLGFYENHQMETVWTVVPFGLLLFIVVPSLKSLFMLESCMFCGLSISIMGHQWYWSYYYKELSKDMFDSYMVPKEESFLKLMDVDNRLIVPNSIPIRFLVSSVDVIHSWTLPSFGVKMDAVPGRVNQFCFSSKRPGVYFGQCSEICGANHSFMPIVMESVKMKDFLMLFLAKSL